MIRRRLLRPLQPEPQERLPRAHLLLGILVLVVQLQPAAPSPHQAELAIRRGERQMAESRRSPAAHPLPLELGRQRVARRSLVVLAALQASPTRRRAMSRVCLALEEELLEVATPVAGQRAQVPLALNQRVALRGAPRGLLGDPEGQQERRQGSLPERARLALPEAVWRREALARLAPTGLPSLAPGELQAQEIAQREPPARLVPETHSRRIARKSARISKRQQQLRQATVSLGPYAFRRAKI